MKLNYEFDQIEKALRSIIREMGISIIGQPKRLIAIWHDLAPGLIEEQQLIVAFLQADLGSLILIADKEDDNGKINFCKTALSKLINNGMDEATARSLIVSFCDAFDWKNIVPTQNSQTNKSSQITPNIQVEKNNTSAKPLPTAMYFSPDYCGIGVGHHCPTHEDLKIKNGYSVEEIKNKINRMRHSFATTENIALSDRTIVVIPSCASNKAFTNAIEACKNEGLKVGGCISSSLALCLRSAGYIYKNGGGYSVICNFEKTFKEISLVLYDNKKIDILSNVRFYDSNTHVQIDNLFKDARVSKNAIRHCIVLGALKSDNALLDGVEHYLNLTAITFNNDPSLDTIYGGTIYSDYIFDNNSPYSGFEINDILFDDIGFGLNGNVKYIVVAKYHKIPATMEITVGSIGLPDKLPFSILEDVQGTCKVLLSSVYNRSKITDKLKLVITVDRNRTISYLMVDAGTMIPVGQQSTNSNSQSPNMYTQFSNTVNSPGFAQALNNTVKNISTTKVMDVWRRNFPKAKLYPTQVILFAPDTSCKEVFSMINKVNKELKTNLVATDVVAALYFKTFMSYSGFLSTTDGLYISINKCCAKISYNDIADIKVIKWTYKKLKIKILHKNGTIDVYGVTSATEKQNDDFNLLGIADGLMELK